MTPGDFVPEQPIFGPGKGAKSTPFIKRYVRTFRVLQNLTQLDFDSCLDVGAAEGYTSALVKRLFGSTAVPADATPGAGAAARHLYGLDPVCVDAHRLPFQSESFDLVISTETVEHLTHPVEAILEMLRVAKKAVLVSTCEATPSPTLAWVSSKLARYEEAIPMGAHINFFRGADFQTLLGDSTTLGNQFIKSGLSRRGRRALRYRGQDIEEIKARLHTITSTRRYLPGSRGVVALRVLDPSAVRAEPRLADEALMDEILSHTVDLEQGILAADAPMTTLPPLAGESLRNRLECPRCGEAQELDALLSSCARCSYSGSVANGVPVLTPGLELTRAGPIDRTRHEATVTRARLQLESLEAVKKRIERRRGVRNKAARGALRCGRRLVRMVEAMRREGRFLGERIRRRS